MTFRIFGWIALAVSLAVGVSLSATAQMGVAIDAAPAAQVGPDEHAEREAKTAKLDKEMAELQAEREKLEVAIKQAKQGNNPAQARLLATQMQKLQVRQAQLKAEVERLQQQEQLNTADASATGEAAREARMLADHGIDVTAAGIVQYIKSLQASNDETLVKELIKQLGDNDYKVREKATIKLIGLPQFPEALLKRALKDPDPEVAMRAQRVLEETQAVPVSTLLDAAFTVVRVRQIKGVSGTILAAMPKLPPDVIASAMAAVAATAAPEDEMAIRELLKSKETETRIQVARILMGLLKEKFTPDLHGMVTDSDESVRLFVVDELAQQGDRFCLEPLGKMLSSEDAATRYQAYSLLRGLTSQKIDYVANDPKQVRETAAEQWRKWIATDGKTAKLNHPMKFDAQVLGRLLMCIAETGNPIIELDEKDQERILVKVDTAVWGVQRLDQGRILVAAYGDGSVREYSNKGELLWKLDLPIGAMRALRLENGNTLIAGTDRSEVWEYSKDKKLVWSHKFDKGRVTDARRLPNGNTLISMHRTDNRVVEIDKNGKIVWQLALADPQTVQRLENGNTLVCQSDANKVSEYDKNGKEVWTYACTVPLDAIRLPNGNTIISTAAGLVEVKQAGKVVWEYKRTGVERIWR